MQKKTMKIYETPQAEALEMETEGVICLSGEVGATMDTEWIEETI